MSFVVSSQAAAAESALRVDGRKGLLNYGIDFLDDALVGIARDDLILIGAESGMGKTQMCVNIALANVAAGKKVHYIALEARYLEIEQRIKYQLFAKRFFSDPDRPKHVTINYREWRFGDFLDSCAKYEQQADKDFSSLTNGLFTYYKHDKFDVDDLIRTVMECSDKSDLIILDHVHYMDFEEENENRAIKIIVKTARMLALEQSIPIILVSHLRKKDKNSTELVGGQEEFHGGSDLFKVCTQAIIFSGGRSAFDGRQETFIRICKSRDGGSVKSLIGRCAYSAREGKYEKGYGLGEVNQKRDAGFVEISEPFYPYWARNYARILRSDLSSSQQKQKESTSSSGQAVIPGCERQLR